MTAAVAELEGDDVDDIVDVVELEGNAVKLLVHGMDVMVAVVFFEVHDGNEDAEVVSDIEKDGCELVHVGSEIEDVEIDIEDDGFEVSI